MNAVTAADGVALLGVRHHGPGSARGVRAALDRLQPGIVLVEGPPEADAVLALAADPGMRPPVALLAHVVDEPSRAGFWPFAEFSPSGRRSAGRPDARCRCASSTCPPRTRSCSATSEEKGREEKETGEKRRRRGRTRASTRSPCWRARPATTTRSGGGRTPSSTAAGTGRGTATRWPRSGRSPRPWACCARPTATGASAGRGARGPHAAADTGGAPRAREGGRGVRGLARARARRGRRGHRRPGPDQGPAQGEGRGHLGALDAPQALPGQWLRGGRRLPRLVPPSVHLARPARRPVDDQGRRPAARGGPPGLLRARHRGGTARRHPRDAARPSAARARRDHGRGTGGDVRRIGCAAGADPGPAGGGGRAGRGPRGRAGGAPRPRPGA